MEKELEKELKQAEYDSANFKREAKRMRESAKRYPAKTGKSRYPFEEGAAHMDSEAKKYERRASRIKARMKSRGGKR